MDDRNKLIEKLGELSAKAYMFGRMYHIDEVTELTKDINELIARVFGYSPWHTGTPTEEGWYLLYTSIPNAHYHLAFYQFDHWFSDDEYCIIREDVIAWQKIEPFKED